MVILKDRVDVKANGRVSTCTAKVGIPAGLLHSVMKASTESLPVGGDVDVALITPFHGFQWLKRKSIMEVLDRGTR